MIKQSGEPAFPVRRHDSSGNIIAYCDGMTLLDYFAGNALLGMLSDSKTIGSYEEFAKNAYLFANAMIKERNKQ